MSKIKFPGSIRTVIASMKLIQAIENKCYFSIFDLASPLYTMAHRLLRSVEDFHSRSAVSHGPPSKPRVPRGADFFRDRGRA